MEHIEIILSKQPRKKSAKLQTININVLNEMWIGSASCVSNVCKALPSKLYSNSKCLDWYDKIELFHKEKMYEFNKTFGWLKR